MHLTRRYFLKSTGAIAAYLGVAPLDLFAQAGVAAAPAPVAAGRTVVVIFLRGGADGLNLVVPHGDPHYGRLRGSIGIATPGAGEGAAIDLDGHFGLHPRLAPLKPLFDEQVMVAAHAVGYDKNTRSHFEEQDVWETGVIGNTINSDGWLNRHIATSQGRGPIRAVAIGDALPRILHGEAPAYAIRGIEDLSLPADGAGRADRVVQALEHAYCTAPDVERAGAMDLLSETASLTLEGVRELRAVAERTYQPAAAYPNTDLGRRLQQAARLIKADVGLEVVEVDYGGWDTHSYQGGAAGPFANLAADLGASVSAFCRDMEERLDDVLLVTLTDFGRTAAENGTGGTDHGTGGVAFVLGGRVRGGRMLGDWPTLGRLHEDRDLLPTNDLRALFAGVLRDAWGVDGAFQGVRPLSGIVRA
ncbi:MAG: DUF1501 domain-containing protein [Myxococcales bacterium]|nr:DUF1501 domain-containing protein [Myxococcales bacterium]